MAASAAESVAASALRNVLRRVQLAGDGASRPVSQVRVVAVSKTKPVSVLKEVYDAGHRDFGENYVQELTEKAPELPDDIRWHFLGHLQSNKAKALIGESIRINWTKIYKWRAIGSGEEKSQINNIAFVQFRDEDGKRNLSRSFINIGRASSLYCLPFSLIKWTVIFPSCKSIKAGVPNLYMVESVDSAKVANNLDRAVAGVGRAPLKVLVQVNTSGEESKFGLEPSQCLELARHVKLECPNLIFSGLMTIGMNDYTSTPLNFSTLASCREKVCKELDLSPDQCELSMGMSGDFEIAIQMGSTNVRVGSTIFGPRSYPAKK